MSHAGGREPVSDGSFSPRPRVRLVGAFAEPFNTAIAAARTCYASRLIAPEDVARDEAARAQRDAIARSTYAAGHHTIWQHATFEFALENVSRQLIWSFLHAHPFYNSEQVSQRYVTVQAGAVLTPSLPPRARARYTRAVEMQVTAYQRLVELLLEPARQAYFALFPARAKQPEKYRSAVVKKAQEIARYTLPVGTLAYLYHTVNGLTLHRYHRLCNMLDAPGEARAVVSAMVEAVRAHDPLFWTTLEDPIALEETLEYRLLSATGGLAPRAGARAFRDAFDAELGGRAARLVDYTPSAEANLARAVRTMVGLTPAELDDDSAIAWVLSPAKNAYLAGALNLTSQAKLTRAMVHPHYTFQKKLSHSADSQDQRHRLTPASRPVLHTQYVGGEPDVIVPGLIAETPAALDCFMQAMRETWRAIDDLLADGTAPEWAMYLVPNAFPIRFLESGDLAALEHKWTTRLCFTAQEEIWRASLDEVREVASVHPRIGRYLGPPCVVRAQAGERPLCPEGSRYCGVPVWKTPREDYSRKL